ncbi:hypothetical protein DI487_08195 [Flavobacterium sediminis]|uniref:Secretion system C-terminal sorting domain-containing protein n=1 Tax=Flavobacterium sediminis TaxID=2201181 RepID=A0A2U8QVE1_9FLAO|nr:T9SS type A sorting domain-containing protein [Flavobacterium sediminis]AWM13844.1 hypothetical protein DI487_08195 [Flavobacterium sediminis]
MKKLYLLSILFISTLSFGQNLAVNGGFENWTGGVVDSWTTIDPYITVEEELAFFTEGSKSAKFTVTTQTQADTDFRQTINVVAGTTYDVSFDVYQLDNESRARLYVDGYLNYSDDTLLNQWQTVTNTYTAATTGTIEIGLRFYDTSANWTGAGSIMYIDNFQFVAQSTPSIAITNPVDGSSTINTDVNIDLSIQNFNVATAGNGDGHISYTVDGGAAIMKYDVTPIALTGLSVGSHTVYAELVDDSDVAIIPAANATVTFDVVALNVVTDLAAMRADVIANGAGSYYQISSNPVISYSRSSRNQKYVQDASAGVLIDDNDGIMPYNDGTGSGPVQGDALSGLQGYTVDYNGVLEFIPIATATVASSGNSITPQVVTASDITSNIEAYESELVQINSATFADGDGTATFASGANYIANDGTDITFRTMFSEANYIGTVIPTTPQTLVVLVAEYNGTAQVVARNLADMPLETRSFDAVDGLTMYPNPVSGATLYINTTANTSKQVQVYDVLGKQVINATVSNNTLNVANLNSGIYIVKITEEGKTATRKLIVR